MPNYVNYKTTLYINNRVCVCVQFKTIIYFRVILNNVFWIIYVYSQIAWNTKIFLSYTYESRIHRNTWPHSLTHISKTHTNIHIQLYSNLLTLKNNKSHNRLFILHTHTYFVPPPPSLLHPPQFFYLHYHTIVAYYKSRGVRTYFFGHAFLHTCGDQITSRPRALLSR
jgi:hypothetical protein